MGRVFRQPLSKKKADETSPANSGHAWGSKRMPCISFNRLLSNRTRYITQSNPLSASTADYRNFFAFFAASRAPAFGFRVYSGIAFPKSSIRCSTSCFIPDSLNPQASCRWQPGLAVTRSSASVSFTFYSLRSRTCRLSSENFRPQVAAEPQHQLDSSISLSSTPGICRIRSRGWVEIP